jgi:AcrR family transcriptional regulator
MTTDYLLFIHGVSVRDRNYADQLFQDLKERLPDRSLHEVPVFWADVLDDVEEKLRETFRSSPLWSRFWFREFRETTLLRFAGDAALYLSRAAGLRVVNAIREQLVQGVREATPEDRLHLITHSMGTVILFDLLFSSRWDDPSAPGHSEVMAIREVIYGIPPNPQQGIKLGSISTMGSPIAIFSLMDMDLLAPGTDQNQLAHTHDITPKLQGLLDNVHQAIQRKLPWLNFAHPGDPIAYPLAELLPGMVDGEGRYLDVQDILTHRSNLTDVLVDQVSQTKLALLDGGEAHRSYWHSHEVTEQLAEMIRAAE